jgi:hypothetical protein
VRGASRSTLLKIYVMNIWRTHKLRWPYQDRRYQIVCLPPGERHCRHNDANRDGLTKKCTFRSPVLGPTAAHDIGIAGDPIVLCVNALLRRETTLAKGAPDRAFSSLGVAKHS